MEDVDADEDESDQEDGDDNRQDREDHRRRAALARRLGRPGRLAARHRYTHTHTHTHTRSTPTAASNNVRQKRTNRAGQKSNLLILREYVNKTEEEYKQIRTAAENMKHCLTFSRQIFCVTIVLCLNIR